MLFGIMVTDDRKPRKVAHLLRSLPAFDRADGEAESGGARDVWNVHVVVEPFVPPVRKHRQCEHGRPDVTEPSGKPRALLLSV